MKHKTNRLLITICTTALLTCSNISKAEEPWHDHSLNIYRGYIDNVATVKARDTYLPVDLGNDEIIGIGYSMAINQMFETEISVSKASASGTQRNASGSGNEANSIAVGLDITRIYLTGKFRMNSHKGMFVPWLGLGINGGAIEASSRERFQLEGGNVSRRTIIRTSSIIAAHGSIGFDFYPSKQSAFAVAVETRYDIGETKGLFDSEINGFSILLGIKWDFWQKGL